MWDTLLYILITILILTLYGLYWHSRGQKRLLAALYQFSMQLEPHHSLERFLQQVCQTLLDALRLQRVHLRLGEDYHVEVQSVHFQKTGVLERFSIVSGTISGDKVLGFLQLERPTYRPIRSSERSMILIVTRQLAATVQGLQLNSQLHSAREKVVQSREEERRRLRRELHDSLGPILSSLSQRLDAAGRLVSSQPEAAHAAIEEVRRQMRETVAMVRQLAYTLRPPVLDEFGLVFAVEEFALNLLGSKVELRVSSNIPLPALPAAVEVAAYRIAAEAVSNVAKHAGANHCLVRFVVQENMQGHTLRLEVSDDGQGFSSTTRAGVGFSSMKERASELGGSCQIESHLHNGVRVQAEFPLLSGMTEDIAGEKPLEKLLVQLEETPQENESGALEG